MMVSSREDEDDLFLPYSKECIDFEAVRFHRKTDPLYYITKMEYGFVIYSGTPRY